ncbi:MAG: class B sortase, partial [Defluviitaleaceae bacterium]|nr:class B sortase [Defluviitaleaceae bacterium]
DGTVMFGSLANYLDDEFFAAHPIISFMDNGYLSEFEVFSARASDIYDPAYFLDFSDAGSYDDFLVRIGAPISANTTVAIPAAQADFSDVVGGAFQFESAPQTTPEPETRKQIITLSTCIGANNDRRMIVQGILRQTYPVTTEHGENGWRISR